VFEQGVLVVRTHAGLRTARRSSGLRWGAVDFTAGVLRAYDNWVRNEADGTKTSDSAPIPMTRGLRRPLLELKHRDYCTDDDDHVFASDARGRPVSEKLIRSAFKDAAQRAGLRSIPMYNLRHSFGTGLASGGIDIRTISALMRHDRISNNRAVPRLRSAARSRATACAGARPHVSLSGGAARERSRLLTRAASGPCPGFRSASSRCECRAAGRPTGLRLGCGSGRRRLWLT